MKASEVRVGAVYRAKVNGVLCDVRVDFARDVDRYVPNGRRRHVTVYDCTNLRTNKKIVVKSAARFRSEVVLGGPAAPGSLGETPKQFRAAGSATGRTGTDRPNESAAPATDWKARNEAVYARFKDRWEETERRHASPTGWATLGYEKGPDGRCVCAVCLVVRERRWVLNREVTSSAALGSSFVPREEGGSGPPGGIAYGHPALPPDSPESA